MYLFQFDIVFAPPDRVYKCKFQQTAENEDTASKEPHFGHFYITDFGQCFALCRCQRDECQHRTCAKHNSWWACICLQPK